MEQAKKRDHKIFITDTAVNKITETNISYYSAEQNDLVNQKHRELLTKSMQLNDSNETAILFNLNSNEEVTVFGSENSVDIFENPIAFSMVNNNNFLFLAYNHPSTQNFSYADLGVFIMNDSINGLSAVSNMGVSHIIAKTPKYDFTKSYEVLKQIRDKYDIVDDIANTLIVKEFLKYAKSLGIEYR